MPNYQSPEIEFDGQVRSRLDNLTQNETYGGLLEGLPTEELNARIVDAIRQHHSGVHVVSAVARPPQWQLEQPYSLGTPSFLPPVQCVARLSSMDDGIYRVGWFAWFQHTWAMPIESPVLDLFRTLVWSEHAPESDF